MKPKQTKTQRIAELERKLVEATAIQADNYHFADANIGKASTEHMRGSGVIITIKALGGREIVEPVLIPDGLSVETIDALRSDLRRAFLRATELKPRGV